MSGSINVLVKDKETHQESIITYKAFRDTSYRFDLIGQVDDQGILIQSDPNLLAQHQRKVPASAPVVAKSGPHEFNTDGTTVPDWLIKKGQDQMQDKILTKWASQEHIDRVSQAIQHTPNNPTLSEPQTLQPFHVEQSVIEEPFPDCPPALPTEPTPVPEQPIKERKKPGPKPKNKEA